ncbi:hypothetical protein SacmaDRAFT_4622 [Saccharomonospora marina XMU15]|uniref:Uncharacterized protein n=1 Tax=Saccharomonospora marina XMU15 TaxID=882083 RepID=H5WWX3_9PSEU|nr:hypothetical protein [Saccharomonospora marina]EHR52801.1 hypothetical protein SacmaDRAFT_4622 [Saccharomonospora marina XMU15]
MATDRDRPADEPAPPPRRRHRRIEEVFGEVVPETTSDEKEPGGDRGRRDEWYLENRPPHHDG